MGILRRGRKPKNPDQENQRASEAEATVPKESSPLTDVSGDVENGKAKAVVVRTRGRPP